MIIKKVRPNLAVNYLIIIIIGLTFSLCNKDKNDVPISNITGPSVSITCPNNICDAGEDPISCPSDCKPTSPDYESFSGAGDIGTCNSSIPEQTAKLLDDTVGTIFTTGDNVQGLGTMSEYLNCFGWIRHLSRIRPSPGNHDLNNDTNDYYKFFGAAAGPFGLGYYSYEIGNWHIISLNSNANAALMKQQLQWLQTDLETNNKKCSLAYWHHPLFFSAIGPSNDYVKPFWQILLRYNVELVINGHYHFYERYARQNENGVTIDNGIREFLVGTGGYALYNIVGRLPNSEVRLKNYGILELTLYADKYSWLFRSLSGISDYGTDICK